MPYIIGADPELFLKDRKGKFKSAHDIIPGSKNEPFEVLNGFIQVDGVAAEFNVEPAATAEEFSQNIRDVLTELSERVSSKNKNLSLHVAPTATFDKKYFNKLPTYAKRLGCEPDMNVYREGYNAPPETKEPFRTGAGHIHVGWSVGESVGDSSHLYDCRQAVRQLDSILYIPSLLWDDDEKRRTLYGEIGSFRPKHYGVEYRPLSNAWVADPDLHLWVFNATKHAMLALDDDLFFFHDPFFTQLLAEVQENKTLPRSTVLAYYNDMVKDYELPPLPASYTK